MATNDTSKSRAIPQREDIAEQHRWNLMDLYATEADWEKDFGRVQEIIKRAADYHGKLTESAEQLYACLELRTELIRYLSRLAQYASLNRDIDNRVSKFQELTERASLLSSMAATAFAFIEPELLRIEEKQLLKLASEFPKTDVYDFYISELIRSKEHIRSKEVEEVLAASSVIGRAPGNIFSMLDDADLVYGEIEDDEGSKVQLTKQRYAKFLESSNRRVRRDANNALMKVYAEHINSISATLGAGVNADVFYSRARRYASALHASLDSHNIPVEVYHSLLDTVEEDLAGLHKYVGLRKRLLKLDDIKPYDMMCPLLPEKDYEVKYGEAVRTVQEAVAPLGEKYAADLKKAFESRWVDVYESQGKGSGAYSSDNYFVHPFVLMNYNDTVDNMFTLAHEMGHAMHSHLTSKTQPYSKSHYSIFVAEVASTLNEGLMLHYLKGRATDKMEKLYLVNRYVDNTVGTFFFQTLYARFELAAHHCVEKGGALSPESLKQVWLELSRMYYGPEMEIDEFTPFKWARIPHFYSAYYVYQYATSFAASQAILDKFLRGEEGIIEKYLKMLSAGGSDHPIELLKICGIDMTTPDPVKATLAMFEARVNEMAELSQE